MKIAFFNCSDIEVDFFSSAFKGHDFIWSTEAIHSKNVDEYSDIEVISIRISSNLNSSLLKQLTNLKLITVRTTGYDNVDVEYCREHGIKVSNVPDYGDITVAEYTFALMMALLRKLPQAIDSVASGIIDQENLQGVDLHGKTLGIIGTGRIGANVARISHGFGMDILAYDLFKNESLQKFDVEYTELENLLKNSDIISLHLPLTTETHHFIDRKKINMMKPGVFIINTGRGGLIDAGALAGALRQGHVSGAALDVLEVETYKGKTSDDVELLSAQEYLRKSDSVIVTPHNAFNTAEACERIRKTTVKNILSFISGQESNIVV